MTTKSREKKKKRNNHDRIAPHRRSGYRSNSLVLRVGYEMTSAKTTREFASEIAARSVPHRSPGADLSRFGDETPTADGKF